MVDDRAGKVVVLVVAGVPVEKSEICIAPTDQLFDLSPEETSGSQGGKAGRLTYW
jgi:hypothetical protein